jgi:uncharacterized protein YdeI (BOF family)
MLTNPIRPKGSVLPVWLAAGIVLMASFPAFGEPPARCNYCMTKGNPSAALETARKKGGPFLPAGHHARWSYMNTDCELVLWPQFANAKRFSEGLAAVCVYGTMGHEKGKLKIFSFVEHTSRGDFKGYPEGDFVNRKWGYINESFEFVIAPAYDRALDFKNGLAFVVEGGQGRYIDKHGKAVFDSDPGTFDKADVSEGLVVSRIAEQRFGYRDTKGEMVIEPVYEDAWPFSDGLARVRRDGLYGFIDAKGNVVIDIKYDGATDFNDGLASVSVEGKWGLLNKKGDFAVKPQYQFVGRYSEKLAPVMQDDKFGFIDAKGKLVIDPQFAWAGSFVRGMALVNFPGRPDRGFVDKTGAVKVGGLHFDYVGDFDENGLVSVGAPPESDSVHSGYINRDGVMVWSHAPPHK